MDKSYVEQYGQLENTHWWFLVRRKIILQTLGKYIDPGSHGKLKILNTGAAAGGSSKWLSVLGEVTSLENDALFVSYLTQQHLAVVNASVTDIPLPADSFDLVCALDVIEHLENDTAAIDELIRVCKPGGIICITVPAFQSLWGSHDVVNGHKRRYLKKDLLNAMSDRPGKIAYLSYFNTVLFLPVFLFRKLQKILEKNSRRADSDFAYFKSADITNNLLKMLFGSELFLLKWMKFPFGVSLIMLIRKTAFPGAHAQ